LGYFYYAEKEGFEPSIGELTPITG